MKDQKIKKKKKMLPKSERFGSKSKIWTEQEDVFGRNCSVVVMSHVPTIMQQMKCCAIPKKCDGCDYEDQVSKYRKSVNNKKLFLLPVNPIQGTLSFLEKIFHFHG